MQDFLQRSVDHYPAKTALIGNNQRLTYGQVEAMANKLANAFRAHVLRHGDQVAIYRKSVETAVAIFPDSVCRCAVAPLIRSGN